MRTPSLLLTLLLTTAGAAGCLDDADDRAGGGEGEGEGEGGAEGEGEGGAEGEGEGGTEGEGEGGAEGEGEGPAPLSCTELYDCVTDCGSRERCRVECGRRATQDARWAHADLRGCEWLTCEGDAACVAERCGEWVARCEDEPGEPMACAGLYSCYGLYCTVDGESDAVCVQDVCQDGGSEGAIALQEELNSCVRAECLGRQGQEYNLCVSDRCGWVYAECLDRRMRPVTCRGITGCRADCDGDRDCERWCEDNAIEQALRPWDTLTDCLDQAGCDPDDTTCAALECPRVYAPCADGCLGVALCRSECRRASCESQCRRDAPGAMRAAFDDWDDCLDAAGCREDDAACALEACPELTAECAPWLEVQPAEGEGEGPAAEGEGEGPPAEGEGEGEGPPAEGEGEGEGPPAEGEGEGEGEGA